MNIESFPRESPKLKAGLKRLLSCDYFLIDTPLYAEYVLAPQ